MDNTGGRNTFILFKKCVLLIILICLLCILLMRRYGLFGERKGITVTKSTLQNVIDISELSTAKFTYNGIAQAYKGKKVKCNMKYEAEVRAKIDMSKIEFEIDKSEKVIRIKLPQIQYTSDIRDERAISFIPSKANLELKEAIDLCEQDALDEASSSKELRKLAKENMKATLQALLMPVLVEKNYRIVWA